MKKSNYAEIRFNYQRAPILDIVDIWDEQEVFTVGVDSKGLTHRVLCGEVASVAIPPHWKRSEIAPFRANYPGTV
jgi:hypothetical protein